MRPPSPDPPNAHGPHAGHGHDHAGHHHHALTTNRPRLWAALFLIVGFMAVEIVVGILADSVALLADAAHMLVDALAIGLSLVALHYAARPARGAWTFGFKRAEILSAQANGLTLFVLAGLVVYESVRRLLDPPNVGGGAVLAVAGAGAAVNLVALWILSGADRRSLNIEGSYQHVLMDLLASIATIVAGAVILATGYDRADAIVALVVAALMIRSAWGLVGASARVLMEAAPAGIDPDEVGRAMADVGCVVEVHDLHLWEVTSGFPALSAHVVVERDCDCHAVRRSVEALLRERFGITHSTMQTDHETERLHAVARGVQRA